MSDCGAYKHTFDCTNLRTNTGTHMDEEADDRATHKDADGAHIVPDVAAHARTDDHAGSKC